MAANTQFKAKSASSAGTISASSSLFNSVASCFLQRHCKQVWARVLQGCRQAGQFQGNACQRLRYQSKLLYMESRSMAR